MRVVGVCLVLMIMGCGGTRSAWDGVGALSDSELEAGLSQLFMHARVAPDARHADMIYSWTEHEDHRVRFEAMRLLRFQRFVPERKWVAVRLRYEQYGPCIAEVVALVCIREMAELYSDALVAAGRILGEESRKFALEALINKYTDAPSVMLGLLREDTPMAWRLVATYRQVASDVEWERFRLRAESHGVDLSKLR